MFYPTLNGFSEVLQSHTAAELRMQNKLYAAAITAHQLALMPTLSMPTSRPSCPH